MMRVLYVTYTYMLLTTTNTVEGKTIREYKGMVSSDVIYGAHVGRDILASMRDFFGGRSRTYEKLLMEAKQEAKKELEERATAMGANAVIAIDFEFATVGMQGSMLMVNATGTAVVLS